MDSTRRTTRLVYGLVLVWTCLTVISFVSLWVIEPTGDGFVRGLNRTKAWLSWQALALATAFVAAFVTGRSRSELSKTQRLLGFGPIALTGGVFTILILAFVAAVLLG